MQELLRYWHGFYQKYKKENVVGTKLMQLELQPQGEITMDNRAGGSIAPLSIYFEAKPFPSNDIPLHSHQDFQTFSPFLDNYRVSHGKMFFFTPTMRIF